MKRILVIVLAALSLSGGALFGQDLDGMADKETDKKKSDQGDKKEGSFSIHGYVQANFVVSRNDDKRKKAKWHTSKYEFPRVGGTTQLELEGNAADVAHFYSSLRLEYNATGEKTNYPKYIALVANGLPIQQTLYTVWADYDRQEISKAPSLLVRESYVDLYGGKWMNIRVGQQLISWGEIEGIEAPTDIVMPWDYTTKSTVFEDSRLSVTAAVLNFFFAKQQLQFIYMPLFQPAKIPQEVFFRRGANRITRPRFEARNGEYAARLSGNLGSRVRYGLGFLYGFDDMPDTHVRMAGSYQNQMGFMIFMPSYTDTELYYNRAKTATFDLGVAVGDAFTWKTSAMGIMRTNWGGDKFGMKNSTAEYLTGIESTNIFAKIYLALYVGQMWVINYTPRQTYNSIDTVRLLNIRQNPNEEILDGYDQAYPYKWLLSGVIQRSLLQGNALDIQVRFFISAKPNFGKMDYVVNPTIKYTFTNSVSASIGIAMAHRQKQDQNMGMLELRYSF